MQFQVPQFIEVEDKIFGPLTFRQFIYIGGGVGAAYLLWRAFPIYIAGPLIALIGGLAGALAFLTLNGRPFILGLESGFFFLVRSKLYLWNNVQKKRSQKQTEEAIAKQSNLYIPKLSQSKLHELAWSLDIKERIASGTAAESERLPREKQDVLAPIVTAESARATKEEAIAQRIDQLSRERTRLLKTT